VKGKPQRRSPRLFGQAYFYKAEIKSNKAPAKKEERICKGTKEKLMLARE
jgi:hypothetical protein